MFERLCSIVVSAVLLYGCATQIPPEVIASADYGPPPPENYQELIRAEFAGILIDPTSPIYQFDEPRRGYTREAPMFNTQQRFGWRVCGTVNSRNRFGGYVGSVPFFVLFQGNRIEEMIIGRITTNEYGINLVNSTIIDACTRTVS